MAHAHLYQPAIHDRNVRRIYRLKQRFKRQGRRMPMTVILNRILDDFFDTHASPLDEDEAA
jgi:hypothetical protein